MSFDDVKYIPILCLKPAEMAALEELPEKDKDNLLPLIPLKKWTTASNLEKACARLKKAFSDRPIILDLDRDYLKECIGKTTQIAQELLALNDSSNGYANWVSFFKENPNYLPVLQLQDSNELHAQIDGFIEIKSSIVLRLELTNKLTINDYTDVLRNIYSKKNNILNLLIILDYGDFDRTDLINVHKYVQVINWFSKFFPEAKVSISGTSFPYSFTGSYKGEIPIYERQIYNKIVSNIEGLSLIYSDRGSARANSLNGGGGVPPPRIDYPLKNDWRFVRKEFITGDENEKEFLYYEACKEVIASDYWDKNLHLWGTQMIEKTALKDPYGITSPQKATAVRINIHLYIQLHYFDKLDELDTDEDWVD